MAKSKMENSVNLNRKGMASRLIIRIVIRLLLICFLACAFLYWLIFAPEVRESNKPLTFQEATLRADSRLPAPNTAKNIYFFLSGHTQYWDLYVCFEAPLKDIEDKIQEEFRDYDWHLDSMRAATSMEEGQKFQKPMKPEQGWTKYEKQNITEATIPADVRRKAPSWWTPEKLGDGYFIGSTRADGYGPRFWVDPKAGKVFYFEHYD